MSGSFPSGWAHGHLGPYCFSTVARAADNDLPCRCRTDIAQKPGRNQVLHLGRKDCFINSRVAGAPTLEHAVSPLKHSIRAVQQFRSSVRVIILNQSRSIPVFHRTDQEGLTMSPITAPSKFLRLRPKNPSLKHQDSDVAMVYWTADGDRMRVHRQLGKGMHHCCSGAAK